MHKKFRCKYTLLANTCGNTAFNNICSYKIRNEEDVGIATSIICLHLPFMCQISAGTRGIVLLIVLHSVDLHMHLHYIKSMCKTYDKQRSFLVSMVIVNNVSFSHLF